MVSQQEAGAAQRSLLQVALSAAVPLWMAELAGLAPAARALVVMRWAANAVEPIASRGDALQFGSKRSGEAADVFNHLARGLAALAQSPGGVVFCGLHWCVEHPGGVDALADRSCTASGLDPVEAVEAVARVVGVLPASAVL